jgi:hypothetical protein
MARRLLDAQGRRVRDAFKVTRWARHEVIRRVYFRRIDWAIQEFGEDGLNPPDDAVLALVGIGITNDDSFEDHCLKKGEANPEWPLLRQVGARVVYEDYIKAIEDGTWPEN